MVVVDHLTMRYTNVVALDTVSLVFGKSERIALVGSNGSGKSTLLRAIAGHSTPSSGSVSLSGTRVVGGAPWRTWQQGVGSVLQSAPSSGDMSCRDYVIQGLLFTLWPDGLSWGRSAAFPWLDRHRLAELSSCAQSALVRVGLGGKANENATTLTREEKRFLEIARALAPTPRLLLLDEPAAGMTPDAIARLEGLLEALARDGVGMVLAEHVLTLSERVTSRAIILSAGAVRFDGSWQDFWAKPDVHNLYFGGPGRA